MSESKRCCSTCKQPCKGHEGPTGKTCKNKPTEDSSSNDSTEATGQSSQITTLLGQLVSQMKDMTVSIGAMQQSQVELARILTNSNPPAQEPTAQREATPPAVQLPTIVAGMNIPEKAIRSAQAGEFVQLSDFVPSIHPKLGQELETVASANGTVEFRYKRPTKNIDGLLSWLQCWNIYEQVVITANPGTYIHLCSYRQFIQECDRKFTWNAVYAYDVRHRCKMGNVKSLEFDNIDQELYTTILDATAVKKGQVTCFRCKSPNHVVQRCPFPAEMPMGPQQETPKETQHKRKPPTKWFHQGKEGCNNFQYGKCVNAECVRAHVCKQCRGPEPWQSCRQCNNA